jgi:hypothetical protein
MRIINRYPKLRRGPIRIVRLDERGRVINYGYLHTDGKPIWFAKRQPYNPNDYCYSSE